MPGRRWFLVALLAMPGCNLTGFEDSSLLSPDEIQSLIDKAPYPELTPTTTAVQPTRVTTKPDGTRVVTLNLVEALRLTLENNQAYLVSVENLDLQLLSLEVMRRSWWPLPSPLTGSVSYGDSQNLNPAGAQSLSASVSQKMPWGGSTTFSYTTAGAQVAGPNFYTGGYTLGVNLPLLRGGGWRVGVESQVSAERGYVYSRRTYQYRRTEIMIQTVQSYFGLKQQEKSIANFQRSLEAAQRGVELATLQFGRGKVTRTDVFREELSVTNAENQLSDAHERLRLTRDAFKIDLGLSPGDGLILEEEKIDAKPLEVDREEAIEAAFQTNPQWLNSRDQFDDAGRALEIARNATLPQFDIGATYAWAQEPTERPFEDFETGSSGYALTGSFSIDLDRTTLARDYQAAVISYRQAERAFRRTHDEITRQTQDLLNLLRQAETSTRLQFRAKGEADKSLQLQEIEYDRGQKRNFEVIDARNQLTNAENAFEAALVSAKVAQLRLLHWIGRLEPDDEGRWFR